MQNWVRDVILPCRGDWSNHKRISKITKNPINHQITKGDKETQDFSLKVHVLAGMLRPRCVDQHFVVRRLIGIPHPSSPRALQGPTTSEVAQWHVQSANSCLWLSAGVGTKTPHNHQEMTTNNHQLVPMLHRSSKPSRWQQLPRVTSKPATPQSLVPLDAQILSKCN